MAKDVQPDNDADAPERTCGIVMPISAIDGCDEGHWTEVLAILSDAIESAGFRPNIVSNADEAGIIQKRIIQNLYENPIVVCDVSGKNPNVMFELGMRLAFDKPTIIVKDNQTQYSFDTAPIEHVEYPRDLRFSKIVEFKSELVKKVKATFEASQKSSSYTTFLKHFGEFKVAKIEEKEVSSQEYLLEELAEIKLHLSRLSREARMARGSDGFRNEKTSRAYANTDICLEGYSDADIAAFLERVRHHAGVSEVSLRRRANHQHLICEKASDWPQAIEEIRADLMKELEATAGKRTRARA